MLACRRSAKDQETDVYCITICIKESVRTIPLHNEKCLVSLAGQRGHLSRILCDRLFSAILFIIHVHLQLLCSFEACFKL